MKNDKEDNYFIPDFCNWRAIAFVAIAAQAAAVTLSVSRIGLSPHTWWWDFLVSTVGVQMISLVSAGALCQLRPVFKNLKQPVAMTLGVLTVCLVALLFSAMFVGIMNGLDEHGGTTGSWDAYFLRNVALSAIIATVAFRYFDLRQRWEKNVKNAAEARLDALQSKIRPHFFFNSMNTIASLTRSDPPGAEEAVENLATLFRASLSDMQSMAPLRDEIDICRRYLAIEKLRLSDRLVVTWDVDDVPGDALLPPLVLQPLLENSIYHGVQPRPQGGEVRVEAKREGDQLSIIVRNPLPEKLPNRPTQGNQMAFENTRQRLLLAYNGKADIHNERGETEYTVTVTFPYWRRK